MTKPREVLVGEAITKIVIGQMLSRKATDSIHARVVALREQAGLFGSWQIPPVQLVSAGLSGRKARTIFEFGKFYDSHFEDVEAWRALEYEELSEQVTRQWGLSRWSVDMLAIFYFGKTDVFPETDGTIKRAITKIESLIIRKSKFNPLLAKPFRSYLAFYLWASLDRNLLR